MLGNCYLGDKVMGKNCQVYDNVSERETFTSTIIGEMYMIKHKFNFHENF